MRYIINVGKKIMQMVYALLKILQVKNNKVLFLSRQENQLSLDFRLLKKELLRQKPEIQIVEICNRIDDKKEGKIKFGIAVLKSMFHLATSKVCVLDAYWPAVSMLQHKKELTVIQMWHALGKIKKSGYQTVGKESGRSVETSELLCMHKNYDYIIAGGKAWNPYYMASFGTTEDKLVNIGLPRIDYIIESEGENQKRVYEKYPMLKDKTVILYAPTFRRNIELKWEELQNIIDYDKYALVVKGHPNQKIENLNEHVYVCPEFTAVELLAVCDYLITDYSAIAIEAAILRKKTYYYLYDYEEYTSKNGINIDLFHVMEGCVFREAKELWADLSSGEYNIKALENYREKYLPDKLGTSTKQLAEFVIERL